MGGSDHIRRKNSVRLYDILLLDNKKSKIKSDKTTIIIDLSINIVSCKICGKKENLTDEKKLEPKDFFKYKEILQEEINKFKEKHNKCKIK
jgi:hypothetical protein